MKILRIGDPHVRPSNIEESFKVMEFACHLAGRHAVDRIEILGDLFHTHAIVRIEVLEFWKHWFDVLTEMRQADHIETVVLVGNHDMTGDHNSTSHAMSVFAPWSMSPKIIDKPTVMGLYGYLPYQHSLERYTESVRELASAGAKTLVCHQTITGSQYENGFYAPDGIDPAYIPFDLIFSGHIHKRQIITAGTKTIIYPGTSRWESVSDANEEKGLWIYEHDDQTAKLLKSEFFSTAGICKPILSVTWEQERGEMPDLPNLEDIRLHIELIGTSDWIKEQKKKFLGRASIKAKITDSKSASRKAGDNIAHFVENIFQTSMDRKQLLEFMRGEDLV